MELNTVASWKQDSKAGRGKAGDYFFLTLQPLIYYLTFGAEGNFLLPTVTQP